MPSARPSAWAVSYASSMYLLLCCYVTMTRSSAIIGGRPVRYTDQRRDQRAATSPTTPSKARIASHRRLLAAWCGSALTSFDTHGSPVRTWSSGVRTRKKRIRWSTVRVTPLPLRHATRMISASRRRWSLSAPFEVSRAALQSTPSGYRRLGRGQGLALRHRGHAPHEVFIVRALNEGRDRSPGDSRAATAATLTLSAQQRPRPGAGDSPA